MTLSTSYEYTNRGIFDIKTIFYVLRLLFINSILAIIFFFITLEELDWCIYSFAEGMNDNNSIIDNTSWNIYKLF